MGCDWYWKIFLTKFHTQFGNIKENENSVKMKQNYLGKLTHSQWHRSWPVSLSLYTVNNVIFSETGKWFWNQYNITSSQMFFFNYTKSTFVLLLLLCSRFHVSRLLGWKSTNVAGLPFINHSSTTLNLSQTALHIPCNALWDGYHMVDGWCKTTF